MASFQTRTFNCKVRRLGAQKTLHPCPQNDCSLTLSLDSMVVEDGSNRTQFVIAIAHPPTHTFTSSHSLNHQPFFFCFRTEKTQLR